MIPAEFEKIINLEIDYKIKEAIEKVNPKIISEFEGNLKKLKEIKLKNANSLKKIDPEEFKKYEKISDEELKFIYDKEVNKMRQASIRISEINELQINLLKAGKSRKIEYKKLEEEIKKTYEKFYKANDEAYLIEKISKKREEAIRNNFYEEVMRNEVLKIKDKKSFYAIKKEEIKNFYEDTKFYKWIKKNPDSKFLISTIGIAALYAIYKKNYSKKDEKKIEKKENLEMVKEKNNSEKFIKYGTIGVISGISFYYLMKYIFRKKPAVNKNKKNYKSD